ncbi:MAG: TrmH family RNA methyltransferase [Bacilli bacterium]
MITKITSKQNEKIKYFNQLKDTSFRNQEKLFIVEGFHLVEMALEKGCVKTIISLFSYKEELNDIEQILVTEEILEKLSSTKTPQGIIAICKMESKNKKNVGNKVLYLDDIQDPGNLGTIIRTALAFSFKDIILSPHCCSIYNPKVIAASQGAIFFINFINGGIDELKELKEKAYQIVATNLRNSVLLSEYQPENKQIIVLGNEGKGVCEEIIDLASVNVRINIDNIDSLNVGIAAGIMMNDANERTRK